jgi:hypothetical protein
VSERTLPTPDIATIASLPRIGERNLDGSSARTQAPPDTATDCNASDAEHLADLLPAVRQRLRLETAIDDGMLLASLVEIARYGERPDRWRAAFNSALGQWLALRGRDLNTTLSVLIQMLPPARS